MSRRSHRRSRRLSGEAPVVVMGRGHSGTRLLAWAIHKLGISMGASATVATGDVQDRRFSRGIKRICRASLEGPVTENPNRRLLRFFRHRVDRYWSSLETAGAGSGWGWKFPETYLIPNYVAATFPQARYIHMLRDGRDVAFKQHLTDDPRRRLGRRLLRHVGAWGRPHHVQAALSWDFQVRRFLEYVEYAGLPVYTLSFESLCRDPLGVMHGVCRFLDCELTAECRWYLHSEIQPAKVAQFRRQDPHQVAEVEVLLAPLLERLGYACPAA